MTEQEAIKYIENHGYISDDVKDMAIKALEKQKDNGWIPCSERLPEEGGHYLVTYHEWSNGDYLPKFNDIHVRRMHYQASDHFTGWNYPKYVDENAEKDTSKEVIAWQPLPEPYKESEQY